MRFDPRDPQHDDNDRFVLSKGHAAPLLYAAWVETGAVAEDDLCRLRQIDCDLLVRVHVTEQSKLPESEGPHI